MALAAAVQDREEQWLTLGASRLDADRAIVFPCCEPGLDFLRALLVDKLLVDDARLPDLIHAYILIKRCHLLLRMAVDCSGATSWIPREERRAAAVLLVIALAADKHHVMVPLRPG